jgi:hypothetical protein
MSAPFSRRLASVLCGGVLALASSVGTLAAAEILIYSDALASGWANWSWSTAVTFSNASPVHAGAASMAVTYQAAWGGLYLHV